MEECVKIVLTLNVQLALRITQNVTYAQVAISQIVTSNARGVIPRDANCVIKLTLVLYAIQAIDFQNLNVYLAILLLIVGNVMISNVWLARKDIS